MAESGNNPPPKPWERSATSTGAAPFKPPSPGSTSDVVEASGTAQPGEISSTGDRTSAINQNSAIRPVPARPWVQQNYTNTYGGGYGVGNAGYGSGINHNTGYGYGAQYGGLYGNNIYRGGYGMYGGGNYGGGLGLPMGGYGTGLGPYGDQDPNNPHGQPSSPPGFWISFLRAMEGVVNFFGRIAMLVDQNTQAFHMFMSALLQLFDRSGMLYGELARFVLRLLGIRTKPKKRPPPGHEGPGNLVGPGNPAHKVSWEGVWDENAK